MFVLEEVALAFYKLVVGFVVEIVCILLVVPSCPQREFLSVGASELAAGGLGLVNRACFRLHGASDSRGSAFPHSKKTN